MGNACINKVRESHSVVTIVDYRYFRLKKEKEGKVEWWELFDDKRNIPYYYNTLTGQTEWIKPEGIEAVVVSLSALVLLNARFS